MEVEEEEKQSYITELKANNNNNHANAKQSNQDRQPSTKSKSTSNQIKNIRDFITSNIVDYPNAAFYLNERSIEYSGQVNRDFILKKFKGNYSTLESRHNFIQWIFPTFVKSVFNDDSYTLQEIESMLFIQD